MIRKKPLFKNKKYNMLKDFDILAKTTQAEKELYEEANFQKGIEMMTPTYVRDENRKKFSLFVSIDEFRQFGPGMYLLFLFLKYATIFFLFISIFSFVNTGLLLSGGQLNSAGTSRLTTDNNFQMNMAKSTLGNVEQKQFIVIIIFDYIITVLVLGGIVFWKQREATYVVECCKQIMLPSYQTIILKEIPELYTEFDMKVFIEERWGEVEDIYTVRDFNDDLYHYKEITKIAKEFKEEHALVKLKPERGSIKLAKLFFEYQDYYFKMQKKGSLSKYPKKYAYIMFKSVKSRQEMLKFYTKKYPDLKNQDKDNFIFKTEELKLKACLMEPNGIKWENLHIKKSNKIMWILIQIFLLILVLFISIILIFILYVSESSLSHTEFYGKNKEYILKLNNKEALQSFCMGLSITGFNADPDCSDFSGQYLKYTILFVALPLAISLFKFILTQIMKALVSVRRHPYEIAKIQSQIIIMFVFYFFASGILQSIAFLELQFQDGSTFSFANIIRPIQTALVGYLEVDTKRIGMATDYNRQWYTIVSYKIILISLVSFNASSFGKIAYSFLRKVACDVYARKQQLQCRMNYWLEGQQMEIQFVYAVAATIICFALLFGSSIPLIYPFTFVSMLILFWSTKFIFINFCAKPLLYSHSMNSLVVKILLFGVVVHSFMAPLYFGAATIHSEQGIKNFVRIPHYGFYIVLMVLPLIYMFYRERLGNFFEKIKEFYEEANDKDDEFPNDRPKKMSLPSKLCLIEPPKNNRKTHIMTYSMHENPEYENILKTLYTVNKQQRVRATCVLNKQLQNLLQKDTAFADAEQSRLPPKIFSELCKITEDNFSKFQKRVGKEYSKSNNPYKFYAKQLKELDRASKVSDFDPQIDAINSQGFMSNSLKQIDLSHMKQNLESNSNLGFAYLRKLQSLKKRFRSKGNLKEIIERSVEQSMNRSSDHNSDDMDGPTSDVRLRSVMNMGLVSNLGMVSNIGGGGYGAVSNLGTMSRVNRNSVAAIEDRFKDLCLIDDRMDCIKETQSVLDSVVLSKRYPNEPPQKDTTEPMTQPKYFTSSKKDKQTIEIKVSKPNKQFAENSSANQTQNVHSEEGDYVKRSKSRKKQFTTPRKIKSKKEQIFKAYKKKKRTKQHIEDGFEASPSSNLEQSREV